MPAASPPAIAPPLVSVVIPAWNRRGTLRMSVESVLRQTFTDFELIVVDDGSTDGTMEAIADLADPRIRRLTHETNKGVSAARNTGIRAARGEWVAFQDSDDEWLPRKLEKQMARLEGAGPEVVACYTGMIYIGEEANPLERTITRYWPPSTEKAVERNLYHALLAKFIISTQMLMARRDVLSDLGGFDTSLEAHEDHDCALRLAQRGSFMFVDEPLVLKYHPFDSITRDRNKMNRARLRFLEIHGADMMVAHPKVFSNYYQFISGWQWRKGDLLGSRASLAAARKARPFSLGLWLRSLRLWGMVLWQRVKGA